MLETECVTSKVKWLGISLFGFATVLGVFAPDIVQSIGGEIAMRLVFAKLSIVIYILALGAGLKTNTLKATTGTLIMCSIGLAVSFWSLFVLMLSVI